MNSVRNVFCSDTVRMARVTNFLIVLLGCALIALGDDDAKEEIADRNIMKAQVEVSTRAGYKF